MPWASLAITQDDLRCTFGQFTLINAVSFLLARTFRGGHYKIKLTANWCIALCSSVNVTVCGC